MRMRIATAVCCTTGMVSAVAWAIHELIASYAAVLFSPSLVALNKSVDQ